MADSIIRGLAYDGNLRVSAVVATDITEELRKRHDTWPVATAALGRALSATLLLSWGLKGEGMVTMRIFGDGPLGGIIVTANAHGEAKGYVQEPHVDLPLNEHGKLDVGGAIGQGDLYISKDIGLGEPYTGSVPLVSGEIGEDVAEYLMQSEQTPSLVAVGVLVNPDCSVAASGGLIIQLMPGTDEEVLNEIAEGLKGVQAVSTLLNMGYDTRGLIEHYLPKTEVEILEETPVAFHCGCNRERISGALKSVGINELEEMIEKDGKAEVCCHFCNEKYEFTADDLKALIEEIKADKAAQAEE